MCVVIVLLYIIIVHKPLQYQSIKTQLSKKQKQQFPFVNKFHLKKKMSDNNSEVHIFEEEERMQQHIDDSAIIPQQQHYNNNNENNEEGTILPIDFIHDRFPYCIVWTPIPLITWLLPFVGHMGIATSEGIIHDFAGPYYISVDNFSFGRPTKYLSLQSLFPDKQFTSKELDEAIKNSKKCYRKLMYNFFCNNCHHFVANVLNQLNLRRTDFTIVELGFDLFFYGKFIGISGVLKTYLPFCILTLLVCISIIIIPIVVVFTK